VTVPPKREPAGPNIVEWYRDFEPPANFRQTIETLLQYVPAKHLVGLKTVILTNREGLTRDQRKKKVWSRNQKIRLADALGSYSRASRSSEATVWLYVDNICGAESSWWRRTPFLRYMTPMFFTTKSVTISTLNTSRYMKRRRTWPTIGATNCGAFCSETLLVCVSCALCVRRLCIRRRKVGEMEEA